MTPILYKSYDGKRNLHVWGILAHQIEQEVVGKTIAEAQRLADRIIKAESLPPQVARIK